MNFSVQINISSCMIVGICLLCTLTKKVVIQRDNAVVAILRVFLLLRLLSFRKAQTNRGC